MNTIFRIISCAALFAAGPAFAECKGGPQENWASVDAAKKAAVEHGFHEIVKVILEDGCYEVVTLNADGKIVGVHFDPVTLELELVEEPR